MTDATLEFDPRGGPRTSVDLYGDRRVVVNRLDVSGEVAEVMLTRLDEGVDVSELPSKERVAAILRRQGVNVTGSE